MVFAINPAAGLLTSYAQPPRQDIAPVSAVASLGAVTGQNAGSVNTDARRTMADRRSFRREFSSQTSTAGETIARRESVRPANLSLLTDIRTSRVLLRAQADRRDVPAVLPPPTASVANDADADGVPDTRDVAPNYAVTGAPRVFGYGRVAALASTAAPTGQLAEFAL